MTGIKKDLEERLNFLEMIRRETEKKLKSVPEGSLRICTRKGNTQYYHRRTSSERVGSYISKRDTALLKQLAQKDYDQRLLASIEKEIKAIRRYLKNVPALPPEMVFSDLPVQRRQLIAPAFDTDEMFVEKWENRSYEGKPVSKDLPELMTDKGEKVRSKSEMIIANLLAKKHIPYKYECPLKLKNHGVIYPDFTVLNIRLRKEIYWEHQGMMDDPEYADKAISKIIAYNLNNIHHGDRLIVTSETSRTPINIRQITAIINYMLV